VDALLFDHLQLHQFGVFSPPNYAAFIRAKYPLLFAGRVGNICATMKARILVIRESKTPGFYSGTRQIEKLGYFLTSKAPAKKIIH
jgi:hypothetical protein